MSLLLRRALPLLLLSCSVLMAAGCGYRNLLAGPPSSEQQADQPVVRVAVRALRSDSPEPWLDRVVGDALRRELDLRGRLRLVDDPGDADLILSGRIRPLAVSSSTFSTYVVAIEYRVTLSLDLEVLKRGGDVIRLAPQGLSETDIYLASQDVEVMRTNRLEALRHLSDVIAVRVADSVEWIAHPERPS
jgi:outer membrane lipopolysaccharide assembly protein LptE/RlpB